MGEVRLVLTYKNPLVNVVDQSTLQEKLMGIGLIGKQLDFYGEVGFGPGASFNDLIKTDLVVAEAPGSRGLLSRFLRKKETYEPSAIITLETQSEIGFDCSPEDLEIVTCPHCRHAVPEWEQKVDQWFNDYEHHYTCLNCGTPSPAYALDFDRLGACTRQKINIWNIGKGTGEPRQRLLNELQSLTNAEFDYFYVRI